MKKAEIISANPATCLSRGSVGRSQPGSGGSLTLHDPHTEYHTLSSSTHVTNVLNNNVEVNGIENGGTVISNNNVIHGERGNARKKSNEAKSREQGSLGYVNERVRALSVSNRTKTISAQRFGPADLRASYNERLRSGPSSLQPPSRTGGLRSGQEVGGGFVFVRGTTGLYRSNSSLDLEHDGEEQPPSSPLRREYGSHGSINVASAPPDALYSILRDLKPSDSSKCPASSTDNITGSVVGEAEATSPKVRSKFQKLWDKDKTFIFKKLRSNKSQESGKTDSKSDITSEASMTASVNKSCKVGEQNSDGDSRGEDMPSLAPARRSAFAHYDCRSLATQFNSSQVRLLLSDRVNTTTGASAAAMAGVGSGGSGPQHDSTEDLRPDDQDPGDGRSNSLINSCPFFRNELGGEGERQVSLSRDWGCGTRCSGPSLIPNLHRSVAAATLGLLEPPPGQSHWRMTLCSYVRSPLTVEAVDQGASYYTTYFCGQEHQNWFGVDDAVGPTAISIRREKVEEASDSAHSLPTFQFRVIVRTSDLFTCQGTVLEESLSRPGGEKGRSAGVREVLDYLCPQLSLSSLRLGQPGPQTEEALIRVDELGVHKKFKVGVLYCRAGQTSEEEMYNNEIAGPAFSEFLEMLGQRVRLKDFDKYRGGLDKKTDSTGLYSVYNHYRDVEVMFHVSTLLPYTSTNRKQLLRKRHIGNDIVTIVFQEPGASPFSPKHIRSHFQHVFIVVQAMNPCTDNTQYRVTVSRFRDVPLFGPMLPEGATFPKSKSFTDFLLAKAINGEIAALRSEKFVAMATRTRHEYLKDLALNHSSSTTLDTSTKFSLMGFSRSNKKDKRGIKYIPDATVRGALSWPLTVHDASLQQNVDCVLGISVDSVVVVEEASAAVIFAAPCKSVLGWTHKPQQGLRLFYHQGECLLISLRPGTPESDGEELLSEVVARLAAVTQGGETQDLVLRRNPAGLLGFNVQQDGVITEVEPYGLASQSGLRQGARLVEICTVTLATLSQEQMVDLLKTSMTVTVTVVPPHPDGTPRRGCNVPTCGFLLGGAEGDYENLTTPEQMSRKHRKSHHSHRHSRQKNSSGYGTASSSRSFNMDQRTSTNDYQDPSKLPHQDYPNTHHQDSESNNNNGGSEYEGGGEYDRTPDYMGTLSSTSSSHSSDRWTEPTEEHTDSPPPPLPARSAQSAKRRGDFFQSSFHNRGGSSNPSLASHPSPPSLTSSSSSPTPYMTALPPGAGTPHPATSSASPTLHASTQYLPPHQWPSHPRLDPTLDALNDNANYAVPPSHPRPLQPHYSEEAAHVSGLGDYDNAPVRLTDPGRGGRPGPDPSPTSPPPPSTASSNSNGTAQGSDYVAWRTERPNGNVRSSSLPGQLIRGPVQDDPALDRLHPTRSEDELSGSSGSPHTKRQMKGGNATPSSTSSRNQSPRTVAAEARLRQSATPRKTSQRNSANLGSSSLQEELFRLINPDYISDSESIKSRDNADRPRAYSLGVPGTAGPPSQPSLSNSSSLERPTAKPGTGSSTTSDKHNPSHLLPAAPSKPATIQVQGLAGAPPLGVSYRGVPISIGSQQPPSITSTSSYGGQHSLPSSSHSVSPQTEVAEVVILTARPATVISNTSTTNSTPTNEHKSDCKKGAATEPRCRPQPHYLDQPLRISVTDTMGQKQQDCLTEERKRKGMETTQHQGLTEEKVEGVGRDKGAGGGLDVQQEWRSLVNTATQAIQKTGDMMATQPCPTATATPLPPSHNWSYATSRSSENFNPNTDPAILHDRVVQLERCLAAEQQRSEQLEDEVSQLRSENRKLQEDSRAAAQQLHQFTEWFFNTIDKT